MNLLKNFLSFIDDWEEYFSNPQSLNFYSANTLTSNQAETNWLPSLTYMIKRAKTNANNANDSIIPIAAKHFP